ncbi:jg14579 [Pararge aegeria aegeria]|uniref:Jg14579 protein n=1 Tax=Pararge aegeria aegeria TaxID=348720 RepID=A0A8S4QYE0_9NEOP|nr:jg14579 [Pararge aegeria aegeria]
MFVYRKIIILLTVAVNFCYGYKVLVVFPIPGRSHSILGEGYVKHLLAAGHEVTYITPLPVKEPHPKLRQVDVSENFKFMPTDIFNVEKFMTKEIDLQDYFLFHGVMHGVLYKTYQLPVIQKFINDPKEQYDVVVIEWLYSELSSGFSSVFNCPYIWSSSMIPHTAVLSLIDDHVNPAYNVHHLSRHYTTTFWDRLQHWYFIAKLSYYRWSERNEYNEYFKNIFGQATIKRGNQLPHFDDVRYNGSMMLGNSHAVTGDGIALPENYKHIGAHPNCVLFITHGGLLSIMETLNAGIPIIGMPFFADQYVNIERAAAKGFGMAMDFNEKTPDLLRDAIKEMVENPSYKQRAKEFSAIFKNNIVTPGQQLAYWVEYVIETKGTVHLRSPAILASWYKKFHIDIVFVFVLGFILVIKLCKSLLMLIKIDDSQKKKKS